jgi:hypothetical protein
MDQRVADPFIVAVKLKSRREYGDIFEDKTHRKQPEGRRQRNGHVNMKNSNNKNHDHEIRNSKETLRKEAT